MATNSGFPRPYTNMVPGEGAEQMMEYVPFDKLGIGARPSGKPKGSINAGDRMNIDHVGKGVGKGS